MSEAILLGLALGDALGYPVEFMSVAGIRARYGIKGVTEPPDPALYSDDTQMTIALTEALLQCGEAELDTLMAAVGREFVKWLRSPHNNRAPGNTCLAGTLNIERGLPWRESGLANSKGCGSAMRVATIGYLYQHQPERLKEVALASSTITHRHPAAQAAALAAAYMVKLALDGLHPQEWFNPLLYYVHGISDEVDLAIMRVGHVEGWLNPRAALDHIGLGWTGDEAVAMALYCLRRHPDDYVEAVRLAANVDGDSDSVACIVGGISAARLGMSAIPAEWIARCENREFLLELGGKLAEKRQSL